MANLENLDYQDWAPGPSPMRSVYPGMSEEDSAMGPGAAYIVWRKDISEHIRPGCVLRMINGDFVLVGDATTNGVVANHTILFGDASASESWRTQDITGVAYPFETGRIFDRLREKPFEEKIRQYVRLATDPLRSDAEDLLMATIKQELLAEDIEFDWGPVPRDVEIAPEPHQPTDNVGKFVAWMWGPEYDAGLPWEEDDADMWGPEYDWEEDADMWEDDMDGDHESALASAGLGTDEDYGHFGDDDGWG